MNTTAAVILTAYNMGDVSEPDFDAWAGYVNDRIDERCGFSVAIEQHAFANGLARDTVSAPPSRVDAIRDALERLWDDFCADASAWPRAVAS